MGKKLKVLGNTWQTERKNTVLNVTIERIIPLGIGLLEKKKKVKQYMKIL